MDWVNMVQTVAFPIVACIAMGAYIYKVLEKMRDSVDKCTKAVLLLASKVDNMEKSDVRGIEQEDKAS